MGWGYASFDGADFFCEMLSSSVKLLAQLAAFVLDWNLTFSFGALSFGLCHWSGSVECQPPIPSPENLILRARSTRQPRSLAYTRSCIRCSAGVAFLSRRASPAYLAVVPYSNCIMFAISGKGWMVNLLSQRLRS